MKKKKLYRPGALRRPHTLDRQPAAPVTPSGRQDGIKYVNYFPPVNSRFAPQVTYNMYLYIDDFILEISFGNGRSTIFLPGHPSKPILPPGVPGWHFDSIGFFSFFSLSVSLPILIYTIYIYICIKGITRSKRKKRQKWNVSRDGDDVTVWAAETPVIFETVRIEQTTCAPGTGLLRIRSTAGVKIIMIFFSLLREKPRRRRRSTILGAHYLRIRKPRRWISRAWRSGTGNKDKKKCDFWNRRQKMGFIRFGCSPFAPNLHVRIRLYSVFTW